MQFQRLTICTDIVTVFKFVKILNHSLAQVLSNKKTAAFCVFCGLEKTVQEKNPFSFFIQNYLFQTLYTHFLP